MRPPGRQVQAFGSVVRLPLGVSREARTYSSRRLNRILADTQFLYFLYKKLQWGAHGPAFTGLHPLCGQHATQQLALVDVLAERVRSLGGVAVGDPRHAAEITGIPRPPDGTETLPAMVSRLLDAHATILAQAREAVADITALSLGDHGTADLLVSQVIRTHETQVWVLAEHLTATHG
nr:DNA starvation/stationary phase protection protein [Streptacidiphilus rugosus]